MKKLCIVGGGVTKDKAPYGDDCLIWSTASVGLTLPRCDAIFELHNGVFSDEELINAGCTVYTKSINENIPNSIAFPVEKIINGFGKHFNGTVVMILAFAALEGYKTIDLYGVDFSSDYEESMRDQFYYILGFLSAKGVKVNIYPGGFLQSECATYMYEDKGLSYIEDIKKRASEKMNEYEHNITAMREGLAYMRGVHDTALKIERRN